MAPNCSIDYIWHVRIRAGQYNNIIIYLVITVVASDNIFKLQYCNIMLILQVIFLVVGMAIHYGYRNLGYQPALMLNSIP